MHFPTLDQIVLETIDLYSKEKHLPHIDLNAFHTPLVVGSNNGYYTWRILFRSTPAYFAVESEVDAKLENIPQITDVVVVSASGEKHAPIILATAKRHGKKTFLISSSEKSQGRDIADSSIIMPKIREPYTYNTSTYFGYMLAETPDLDLSALKEFLTGTILDTLSFRIEWNEVRNLAQNHPFEQDISHSFDMTERIDFRDFSSFFLVLPDQFVLLREMMEVKFIELFGRKIARDIFSYEQMKHATTVVQDERELFICFGNTENARYWAHQVNLPIFDASSYAAMMLLGYYVIGMIQSALPPYFEESIEDYCIRAKAQSGFDIKPWVEV